MAQKSETQQQDQSPGEGGKHVHHGRTGAAWAGSMLAMLAFILGGIAVMMQNWVLFGIGIAITIVAILRWVGQTRADIAELPLEHEH